MAKLDFTINTVLGGAVKATFETLQKGLQDLAKFLREAAAAEAAIQKEDASNTFKKMAQGVSTLAQALNTSDASFKTIFNDIQALEKAQATWANKTTLVQQAWATFSARMMEGTMSLKEAENRTKLYDNAMQKLEGSLKLAGVAGKVYADSNAGQRQMQVDATWAAQALNKELTLQKVIQLQASGAIKLTGQGFKILKDSAYEALLSEKNYGEELTKLIAKLKQVKGEFTSFVNERNKATASGKSDAFLKGLSTINLTTSNKENIVFEQQVKILKQVENALLRVSQQNKTLSVAEREAYTSLDRFNIVSAVTHGHLKITAQGIQVLSEQGLKALGNMSIETANKMGVLDKSFLSFDNQMKSFQKITGLSDAVMKALQSNLMASGKSFADLSVKVNSFVLNSQKLGSVEKQITALNIAGKSIADGPLKTSLEALIKNFKDFANVNTNTQKISNEYMKVGSAVQDLVKQFKEEQKAIEANKKAEQDKITTMNTLHAVYSGLLTSQTQYGDSARRLMAEFARTGEGVGALRGHLSNLNRDLIGSERGAFSLETAIASLGRRMRSYSYFMISSSAINSMTQAFSNATTAIIDHDQALHNLVSITQATQQQEQAMSDTLSEVATTTKFNLEEVAYGMQRLAQGGFNTGEIIQAIKPITDLATGTMESLGQTVDLVSTAIYSFGLNVAEAPRVVDIFANAVTQSRLTVDGLNTAMNYVGPVAHMAGVSLEDTMVILEMFANSGMRASTQGTALRRLFESLLTPSKEFKDAIKQAGMSLEDFNPTITPIEQIIDNLPKVVNDATDAFEMFGTRGANAVSVFAKQGSAEFLRLKAGVLQSGTAAKMAAEQMEGLKVTISMISAKAAELAVAFGRNLVPFVKGALDVFQGLLTILIKVGDSGFGTLLTYLTAATVAFGAFTLAIKIWATYNVGEKIALMATEFYKFSKMLMFTRDAEAALYLATTTTTRGMVSLKEAVLALSTALLKSPLAWFVAIVGTAWAALASYKKGLNEVIQKQFEYNEAMTQTKAALDVYNKEVDKSGASSDAAKKALTTLEAVMKTSGDSSRLAKKDIAEMSKSIKGLDPDSETGKQALKDLSDVIGKKLTESYKKAADSALKLYNISKLFSYILGEIEIDDTFVSVLERGVQEYERLQKAADAGSKAAINQANIFEQQATDMVTNLISEADAAKATEEELNKLALSQAKLLNLSPVQLGALVTRLRDYAKVAKETAAAVALAAAKSETFAGVLKKVTTAIEDMPDIPTDKADKYIGDLTKLQKDYDAWRIKEFSKMGEEVKKAADKEKGFVVKAQEEVTTKLGNELEKRMTAIESIRNKDLAEEKTLLAKKLSMVGYDGERRALVVEKSEKRQAEITKTYETEKTKIQKEYADSSVKLQEEASERIKNIGSKEAKMQIALLNEKRAIILKANADAIADLDDHLTAHKAKYAQAYAKEKDLLDKNLQQQLENLKGTNESEAQLLLKKTQLQIKYYSDILKLETDSLGKVEEVQAKSLVHKQTEAEKYFGLNKKMGEEAAKNEKKFIGETLADTVKKYEVEGKEGVRYFSDKKVREEEAAKNEKKFIGETLADTVKKYEVEGKEGVRYFSDKKVREEEAAKNEKELAETAAEAEKRRLEEIASLNKKADNDVTKATKDRFDKKKIIIAAEVAAEKKGKSDEVTAAVKATSDMHKLDKEQLQTHLASLKEREEKYKTVIAGLIALEASLTDAIIAEREKIRQLYMSTEDTIRELKQAGKSKDAIYAEEEMRLNKLIQEQKIAALAGEGKLVEELHNKIVPLVKEQAARAMEGQKSIAMSQRDQLKMEELIAKAAKLKGKENEEGLKKVNAELSDMVAKQVARNNSDKDNLTTGQEIVVTAQQKTAIADKYAGVLATESKVYADVLDKNVQGLEQTKALTKDKIDAVKEGMTGIEAEIQVVMDAYIAVTDGMFGDLKNIEIEIDNLVKKNLSKPVEDFNFQLTETPKALTALGGAIDAIAQKSLMSPETAETVKNVATDTGAIALNTGSAATNAETLSTKVGTVSTNMGTAATSGTTLSTNMGTAATSATTLSTETTTAATSATTLSTNMGTVASNTTAAASSSGTLASNTATAASDTGTLSSNTATAATNTGNAASASSTFASNLGNADSAASTLASNTNAVASAANAAATAFRAMADAARAAASAAKSASSSASEGHATGGPIHGYGGGDIVPAMLEPGEWVIRKEAVKAAIQRFGSGFMSSLNSGTLKGFKHGGEVSVPVSTFKPVIQMANGGGVSETLNSLKDFGTVKIEVGNKIFPVMAHQNVVEELQRYIRRGSLMGVN